MLSIPVLEPGFRKAALIVSAGHALLFALIWFISAPYDAPPRPMTVRLQLANEQPIVQKPMRTPSNAVTPVKELPAPEVSIAPTPIAKPPLPAVIVPTPATATPTSTPAAVTPTPATVTPTPAAVTPTPVATHTPAMPSATPTPNSTPVGTPVPAVVRSTQPSAASAPAAVLGGTEDRQPTVDASFRGNRIPEYPVMSRRLGEQGVVVLRVLITPNGQASEVLLVKSSGSSRLDRSAMDSIREWRFVPALKGGRPVSAWYEWRWEFRLSG